MRAKGRRSSKQSTHLVRVVANQVGHKDDQVAHLRGGVGAGEVEPDAKRPPVIEEGLAAGGAAAPNWKPVEPGHVGEPVVVFHVSFRQIGAGDRDFDRGPRKDQQDLLLEVAASNGASAAQGWARQNTQEILNHRPIPWGACSPGCGTCRESVAGPARATDRCGSLRPP